MAESVASRTERINDYITDITAVSLHATDPGTTGTGETSGGTPAYARKSPTFTAAGAGVTQTDLSTPITFDIGAGKTVAYYGLWKGTTFFGGGTLSASETFSGQGTYTLTSIPISA